MENSDEARLKAGVPPSGPRSVTGHPEHIEWLREVQGQCKEAMERYPENADWHWRGLCDYLMEEVILLGRKNEQYGKFLDSKTSVAMERGATPENISEKLYPHQRDISEWAIRGGNRAIFAAFGLGKTLIQIQILKSLGGGLIVCPLGVKGEFVRDARRFFDLEFRYVRTNDELDQMQLIGDEPRYFLTNYERIRDGNLDPNRFNVVSLDEASVLRSFGSKTYQKFLTLFDQVKFKFVATATPSPNRLKELIHYAGFLGIMDTGQALTRWFKRDSSSAGNLKLHPHKEEEFWHWVATWATFLQKPSDLGYSDSGYDLPPLTIHRHRLPVDHASAGYDSWGQGKLLRNAATSISDGARERRDSLSDRIERAKQIIFAGEPDQHWIIWHDLEDERRAIEKELPEAITIYGSQDLETREQSVTDFSDGKIRILATKPILSGSGCNFQRFCHSAIYLGVGYKFNDFIQSCHRIQRFLQVFPVDIHLIYTESEDPIHEALMRKWAQHDQTVTRMSGLIRQHGLSHANHENAMKRSIGVKRREESGNGWTAVNADCVEETRRLKTNSVDLVLTSWPFSNHYEYVASYNDFGNNEDDGRFFEQMDFLTPEIKRALKPGRMYCVHSKDRMLYGSVTKLGMYSVNPFSDKCVAHLKKHGLIYCGRITITTDVVRENNQTYRLGWTEQCKDGTKMGVGSPEYILLFRKLPSDTSRAYADEPVVKSKADYTRSRWQFDASPFWRSSGNRFMKPEEILAMVRTKGGLIQLRKAWHEFSLEHIHSHEEHVQVAEVLEREGLLPATFMLLDPKSYSDSVWDDVVRMRTLNTAQSRARVEGHICPLQFDVVDRLIARYSSEGDLVFDPFGGLMTVLYRAVQMGRRGYGIELGTEYWRDGVGYCRLAEQEVSSPVLFDVLAAAGD